MSTARVAGVASGISSVVVSFLPEVSKALTLVEVAQLFNIFVGLMLTMALLVFFGGLFVYFTRLGTWPNNRDAALTIMEWGVGILFVLIIILTIVQFFERYPFISSMVVGGIVLIVISYFVFNAMRASGEEKKPH